ncbi:MAG TPA: Gfo/Idh/MocA family oxidoreductase, partial [Candidatus Limnocylindrales bacterium]|nr:Gfo/Idh/MocA family oxidoreductase [Candidatus Limnocylindrales bacterium]
IRLTTDHRTLFDDKSIDAVAIATPVNTHRKLVEEALAAGKHVFVEKPLAATSTDAEAMVRAAEKAGRTLMVGHTFVYNPAVVTIRGLIEKGELGRVNYVDSQRVNLGLHQFDINVLWDLGPHDVSISLYWLGEEPEWVQCIGACYVQPEIEDVVFLTMGFPSGALAHAHLSWLAPSKLRTMTVIGSKKMAVYDDVHPQERVKVYDFGVESLDGDELRRSYRAGDIHSPRVPITEALQLEMRHFIECVRDGKKPRSDGEAGLRVVRVLEAGMRSLRSGGTRVSYRAAPEAARA